MLERSERRHGWDGMLVLAGPHAAGGTSEAEEAAFLAEHPQVAECVVDLGEVDEAEKLWLLRNTAGIVYPSLYEGFGLIPFEAADAGVPCFFAWSTALRELLPREAATIVEWDADATADAVLRAIEDPDEARRLVSLVRGAAAELTWDRTAEQVLQAYDAAVAQPDSQFAVLAAGIGPPTVVARRLWTRTLSDLDLPEDVYRAFLAFVARPRLRRLLFAGLKLAHRVAYFLRRGRLPRAGDDPFG